MQLVYIAVFGAMGCVSRYLVSGWTYTLVGRGLPYGTLIVNVLGSFLLGVVMAAGLRSTLFSAELRLGLAVGLLGGFTTFSTFSWETIRMLEEGSFLLAGLNVLLNVAVCLAAVGAGIFLMRQI